MNASYAQGWARKNGYAFQNASELDFRSGVIDLTGIREENFVRVSATEVWLRDLEARRLSVGKRFFLAAPQNLYQISYYEVTEMSDPSGGFVTVKCVTPSTDDALNRYEAENQVMMLDPGSIGSRAFAGLPAGTQSSFWTIPSKSRRTRLKALTCCSSARKTARAGSMRRTIIWLFYSLDI